MVGQWCAVWIIIEEMGPLYGAFLCILREVSGPIKVMWTTREYLMGHEKVRKSVSSEEAEMQICSLTKGRNTCIDRKKASWWKWNV